MFLTRTCMNGLIRYNKKGEFNTSFHINRPGIHPDRLEKIINHWNELLNKKDIMFINRDYLKVETKKGDFMYLDPPYFYTKGMYFGTINLNEFLDWLKNSNCSYLLSYDGVRGSINKTQNIPINLYDKHIYIDSGISSFSRLVNFSLFDKRELFIA